MTPYLTPQQHQQLIDNGIKQSQQSLTTTLDFYPVVKLYIPGTSCIWLLSEILAENTHLAWALCDYGLGFPELGTVVLENIAPFYTYQGRTICNDQSFIATQTLRQYYQEAKQLGFIQA